MKLLTLLALPLVLALPAAAQTDAMPPEHNASAAQHEHKKMGAPSTSLTITVGTGAPLTLHLDDLKARLTATRWPDRETSV